MLLPTSQPGTVGLEVTTGPGGGLWLSIHLPTGYLSVLLTSKEAHRAAQTMTTLLMSHRESNASQSGVNAPPFPARTPR